jgi:hypothetical protein
VVADATDVKAIKIKTRIFFIHSNYLDQCVKLKGKHVIFNDKWNL